MKVGLCACRVLSSRRIFGKGGWGLNDGDPFLRGRVGGGEKQEKLMYEKREKERGD